MNTAFATDHNTFLSLLVTWRYMEYVEQGQQASLNSELNCRLNTAFATDHDTFLSLLVTWRDMSMLSRDNKPDLTQS